MYNRYVQFEILHNRLNTRYLLYKMKNLNTNECVYCKNQIETTVHALLECPETTNLWRQVELWLREHVEQSIKISDKEKILGTTEKNQYTFQISMFILITKLIVYQKRPDGLKCIIYDVLRLVKNEMMQGCPSPKCL